jgi:hypothetical protein
MSDADDRFEIIACLDHYAECLDTRNWAGLARVFGEDIDMDLGVWRARNLDEARTRISSILDPCGPSQHLLGNYRIELAGDRASSRCYGRVMHFGKGEHEGKTYEVWMDYADEWVRTPEGWRSIKRVARGSMQLGDPSLLSGAKSRAVKS